MAHAVFVVELEGMVIFLDSLADVMGSSIIVLKDCRFRYELGIRSEEFVEFKCSGAWYLYP